MKVHLSRNVLDGAVHTGRPKPPMDIEHLLRDRDPNEGRGAVLWVWIGFCAVVAAVVWFA